MDAYETDSAPLLDFTQCHAGILKKLDLLAELPSLLRPVARARQVAEQSHEFFRVVIFEHHLDEERELFPAVLESAKPGDEYDRTRTMVRRLTDEHRELEQIWRSLELNLKKMARGQVVDIDPDLINQLVTKYRAHAEFEEREFLPLSQTILSRNANHMEALGLSLHMRHQRQSEQNWFI